jgi:Rrf2 family protein
MISKKTINAIELCVLLAGQRGQGYLTTSDLSPRLDLSISYLENILKQLKESGIVVSMKGPGGGYMIRGDVALISIWDVASVFETTLFDAEVASETGAKKSYELELEQVVIKTLKSFTLSDFADFLCGCRWSVQVQTIADAFCAQGAQLRVSAGHVVLNVHI